MRIAVIGAGNVGSGFGRAAVGAPDTTSSSLPPGRRRRRRWPPTSARRRRTATRPPSVAAEIAPSLGSAVLVDASNPLNETYSDLAIEGTSGAEDVQRRVGGAPVVKAFNTVFASRYENPMDDGVPLQVLIAGDDDGARGRVAELATSLGFEPVEAGGLRFARTLEEMAFLNITLNATNGWPWQTAWQLVVPRG
jgi:predicted dinucleotide-binding enzyme